MAQDLQRKADGPEIFDALDTYYADDVTLVEGTGETFHGKETERARIQAFFASIEEMHGSEIKAVSAHETSPGTGVAFAETSADATFTGAGRRQIEQVSVQQWKDGKVVHERFYYNAAGM